MKYYTFKKIFLFIVIPLIGSTNLTGKETIPSNLNKLKSAPLIESMNGESGEKLTIVNILFNTKVKYKPIEVTHHENFIQIKLSNTVIVEPGKFYDIKSKYIKKAIGFQTSSNAAIIRFMTNEDPKIIQEASSIDQLNNRIVLTVNHKSLINNNNVGNNSKESLLTKETNDTLGKKITAQENSKNISETNLETSPPIAKTSPRQEDKPLNLKKTTDLNAQLRTIAYFSLGMFILLLVSLTFRRLYRNRKVLNNPSFQVPMKTLNQLVLAPKHKISLIQVGHEKILLSISPDGINLLTHINDRPPINENRNQTWSPADYTKIKELIAKNSSETNKQKSTERNISQISKPKSIKLPERKVESSSNESQLVNNPNKKSISYSVGENGINNISKQQGKTSTEEAIEDVTKLIREKLKSLPKL